MQVDTIPPANLAAAVNEMNAMINCSDRLSASGPGTGSRAVVGEDLAALTQARLQARAFQAQASQDNSGGNAKRRRRNVDSLALSTISREGIHLNSLHRPFDPMHLLRSNTVSHINSPYIKVCKFYNLDNSWRKNNPCELEFVKWIYQGIKKVLKLWLIVG